MLACNVDATANSQWVFPPEGGSWNNDFGDISTTIQFGDIDGDGSNDIIFGTTKGYIFALRPGGKKYRFLKIGKSVKANPIMIDFNRDGNADILAFGRDAEFSDPAQKSTMVIISGSDFSKLVEVELDGSIVSRPALADFNNDGNIDILIPARGLYLIDGSISKGQKDIRLHNYKVDGITFSSPIVEDFNDDGVYDFMIPYTYKNKPYVDVFLSGASDFQYSKYTFGLKNELRVIPTLIKETDGEIITWRMIAPSFNKTIDFYVIKWNSTVEELSLQPLKEFTEHDYRFNSQLPALMLPGTPPALYLSLPERNSLWQLNAFSGELVSKSLVGGLSNNMPIYLRKNADASLTPLVILQDDDGLYLHSLDDNSRQQVAQPGATMSPLQEIYLYPQHAGKNQYVPLGITIQKQVKHPKQIVCDPDVVLNLSLLYPNITGYLNQGTYPSQEMVAILREMASTLDWRNLRGMARIASLVTQLYPSDNDFQDVLHRFKKAVKEEKSLFFQIVRLKQDIRKKAAKYDYSTLMDWIMTGKIEDDLAYILRNDPDFLEDKDVAGLYKDIYLLKGLIDAFVPVMTGIIALSLFVLLIFNYQTFIKAYYVIFYYFKVKRAWLQVIAQHPEPEYYVESLLNEGVSLRRPSHFFNLRLKTLLALLICREDFLWHKVLLLLEDRVILNRVFNEEDSRGFYRYLLYQYKRLFYKKLRRESFIGWVLFQTRHFTKRDYYEYTTTNQALVTIKSELALKFLKLNDYRPAFNYLHRQILAANKDAPNPGFTRFLSQLADYKIESYFYKYETHFFKRIRSLEEQVRILTFYKRQRLIPRVEVIVNNMLKQALVHAGFPRHVANDYIPIEPIRDHGLFLTIMAYSHMRRSQVVLRCIPHRYKHIDLTSDARIRSLSGNFTPIANVHRNLRWSVQVETYIVATPLKRLLGNLPLNVIQGVLLSLATLVKRHSPLWFIPNLHPSNLFWDGESVYLSCTGISKLSVDKDIVMLHRKVHKLLSHNAFMTPEFRRVPNPQKVLSDGFQIEKTVVYLLGALALLLLEGRLATLQGDRPLEELESLKRYNGSYELVKRCMLPSTERATLKEFTDMVLSLHDKHALKWEKE
ncbi:MAG: VCBS repeat-containing protein [Candidatus Magnetobacterium sp. LHC-1]|uniref:VCBS repeat-containing protein n=1 Tax=Candidatus Magnetobacterium casense TaxID=1455061 RepID=A0ABS6S0W5_9BACT|nr:VCBS repeat-containing protein [Candidatus Magnetobacterium casensis]MBV6342493.1 VCBS repeat-containing protein [Candidatus Magnetobacterium casensis]